MKTHEHMNNNATEADSFDEGTYLMLKAIYHLLIDMNEKKKREMKGK